MFIIKTFCTNFFTNYSIPDFINEVRNNKNTEQKNRNLQDKLIANSFVASNMIYGGTIVIEGKQLEIKNELLDSALLNTKTDEIKDFKKSDSAYLKPNKWKRYLPKTIFSYKKILKNLRKKKTFSIKRKTKRRKINLVIKSFLLAFRTKSTAKKLLKSKIKKKISSKNFIYLFKNFFRRKIYKLKPQPKENELNYYLNFEPVTKENNTDTINKENTDTINKENTENKIQKNIPNKLDIKNSKKYSLKDIRSNIYSIFKIKQNKKFIHTTNTIFDKNIIIPICVFIIRYKHDKLYKKLLYLSNLKWILRRIQMFFKRKKKNKKKEILD